MICFHFSISTARLLTSSSPGTEGRVVDGREITVQFAKYGPNAERIHKGRISEALPKSRHRSRSRSPRRRYRDDYRDRGYRRRSRSRSWDRYDRDRYHGRDRDYRQRSRSRSASPDYYRGRGRGRYDDERRSLSPYRSPHRSRSIDSASPAQRSPSPLSRSRSASADRRSRDGQSPTSRSASLRHHPADSQKPSPPNSDVDLMLHVSWTDMFLKNLKGFVVAVMVEVELVKG
ncbi:unnamed protein product [Malus baccata var. baccata]